MVKTDRLNEIIVIACTIIPLFTNCVRLLISKLQIQVVPGASLTMLHH